MESSVRFVCKLHSDIPEAISVTPSGMITGLEADHLHCRQHLFPAVSSINYNIT